MMEWTDHVERFDTLGGSVAVNCEPERWALDSLSGEAVRLAVESAMRKLAFARPTRWREACFTLPEAGGPEEFKRRLEFLMAMADGTTVPPIPRAHAMNLLGALRLHRVLLWPVVVHSLPHVSPGAKLWRVNSGMTDFERHLLAAGPYGDRPVGAIGLVLSCSPINSPDDINDIAVKRSVEVATGSTQWTEWKTRQRGLSILQLFENSRRSDGSVVSVLLPTHEWLCREGHIGMNAPRYGELAARPDALLWVRLFDRFSAKSEKKSSTSDDKAFAVLLEFLATFGTMPSPTEVTRATHMLGPHGFLNWLATRSEPLRLGYIGVVGSVQAMLAAVRAGPGQELLIHPDDVPPRPRGAGKSNKALVPRGLVAMACDVCRELLVVAFSQSDGLPNQFWAPAGKLSADLGHLLVSDPGSLPKTLLLGDSFSRLLVTIRGADGALRRIINPVHAVALLWLLRMPARGLETTLLDSGEADEFLPEVREEDDGSGFRRVVVEMRPNTHPLATKRRQLGAICMIPDPGSGTSVPGFYLNTQKRQVSAESNWDDGGRTIPWSDPEMLLLFNSLLKWQMRFNPVNRVIARNEVRGKRYNSSDGLIGKLTGFCYLFRCINDLYVGKRLEPISTEQLRHFFMLVLDEVEARLRSETASKPDGADAGGSGLSGVPLRTAFSLHCLRVTGITALAEDGLPFWIISEILAGHASWVMTQFYNKISPTRVRDALARARSRMEDGTLAREALRAAATPVERLQDDFVSNGGVVLAVEGAQIVGLWLPMIDGICPNGATRCHEGGPCAGKSGSHGPVEGGARNCALCRFFLTGERFIPGQVSMFNGLLHQARRQARGLQELWIRRRAELDPGRARRLDDRVAHTELAIDVTLRTLNARMRLLRKSEALAAADQDGAGSSGGDLLITRLDEEQVAATMRQVSELGFLDEAARVAALVPELDIQDAPIERDRLIDRLLDEQGFEGLLYRLPSGTARAAGDAFTDAVRGLAPAGVAPADHLDAVAEGRVGLLKVDAEAIAAEMSRALGMRIELRRGPGPSLGGAAAPLIKQSEQQEDLA